MTNMQHRIKHRECVWLQPIEHIAKGFEGHLRCLPLCRSASVRSSQAKHEAEEAENLLFTFLSVHQYFWHFCLLHDRAHTGCSHVKQLQSSNDAGHRDMLAFVEQLHRSRAKAGLPLQ